MGEKKNTPKGGHVALYRKYRSKSLSDIVGQEHVTKTLENALRSGMINHAYLFTGPRGTGKTSIARIVAHEINKIPYTDDSQDLDIIEIDAASNRRIDDIRDLREKVHIAPVAAKYKVYIIDEVHMLTNESFNALLKTLEEPPEHVVFMLATTEVHKLPATILSRTQKHTLRLIPKEKVAKHLKMIAGQEKIAINDAALELLAEYGEGSFRDSISLLDQMSAHNEDITAESVELLLGIAPKVQIAELLNAALEGERANIVANLKHLYESGLTSSGISRQLLSLLQQEMRESSFSSLKQALMNELIEVSSSIYPDLKLEMVLFSLSVEQAQSNTIPDSKKEDGDKEVLKRQTGKENTDQIPKTEAKDAIKTMDLPKIESAPAEVKTKTPPLSEKVEFDWAKVLELIKERNNPLYTALRLATPNLTDEELVLSFKFPFHQKKAEDPRYKALIAEIIEAQTGKTMNITSIVDKNLSPSPFNDHKKSDSNTQEDPAHASLISQVQDIMGGGEVVQVQ